MEAMDIKVNLYNSIRDADERRVYTSWNASSISACPRAQYFSRLGVEPLQELTGAKIMRFKAGNILEDYIRPHLKLQFPKLKSNIRLTSETLDLTGEYDNYDPDSKSLIEIKSVHVFAPRHLEKEGQYYHHEYQQHAYKLLLEENEQEVQNIYYVYIALDGQILTFKTEPSQEIEDNVLKRLSLLNEAWEKKEPPMCLCHDDTHPLFKGVMRYCDYRSIDVSDKADANCCDIKLIETIKEE